MTDLSSKPKGIRKTDNNCYLISIIQVLLREPIFITALQDSQVLLREPIFITALQDSANRGNQYVDILLYINKLLTGNNRVRSIICDDKILQLKGLLEFPIKQQEDVAEFFTKLINKLPSSVRSLFQFTLQITTGDNTRYVPYITVVLPLPSTRSIHTLDQLLTEYTSPMQVELGGQLETQITEFKELSEILVIQLGRFDHQGNKNSSIVSYPLEWLPFGSSSSAVYDLYGIVLHIGTTVKSGHYIAIVKTNTGWYSFDDTKVNEITEQSVVDLPQSYLLIYTRRIPKTTIQTAWSQSRPQTGATSIPQSSVLSLSLSPLVWLALA